MILETVNSFVIDTALPAPHFPRPPRYAIWQANTAFIAARNTKAVQNRESLRLAANRFADLSNDECEKGSHVPVPTPL